MIDYSSRRIHLIQLGNDEIFEKEAQQFEQEQCFFIMEVLQVAISDHYLSLLTKLFVSRGRKNI